jgi:hypothetical protein
VSLNREVFLIGVLSTSTDGFSNLPYGFQITLFGLFAFAEFSLILRVLNWGYVSLRWAKPGE